ncbi:MAG TPA: sigma-70 family RNA polymerase sigma factor [Kofleriaceae bacterium]|nr:sigma-70 family RNA polymerase sigma factor [Kofleriaceae bacterium]
MEPATDPHEAYRLYGPALLRKAERVLGNREDARDAVQSLFAELIARGETRFDLPLLYRAVTNRCLNSIRDRKNRDRLLAREEPALRGTARVRCDDAVVGLDLLCKLSARLDARHMEVLVCRYVDDMGVEEIAALVGQSRKTVGKRLARIREEVAALVAAAGAVAR